MIRLAILLLRPVEIFHAWNVRRLRRKGKFRRPDWAADQGWPCVRAYGRGGDGTGSGRSEP